MPANSLHDHEAESYYHAEAVKLLTAHAIGHNALESVGPPEADETGGESAVPPTPEKGGEEASKSKFATLGDLVLKKLGITKAETEPSKPGAETPTPGIKLSLESIDLDSAEDQYTLPTPLEENYYHYNMFGSSQGSLADSQSFKSMTASHKSIFQQIMQSGVSQPQSEHAAIAQDEPLADWEKELLSGAGVSQSEAESAHVVGKPFAKADGGIAAATQSTSKGIGLKPQRDHRKQKVRTDIEAPDAHIVLTGEDLEDQRMLAETIEMQHYVKDAPVFIEQAGDITRTNTLQYWDQDDEAVTITEHEGLEQLHDYLVGAIEEVRHEPTAKERASEEFFGSLLDTLTFIGEKEYTEGARGIAAMWKQYLNENVRNTLCIPSNISASHGFRKSDVYLLERILDSFTDEELEHYKGRIVTKLEKLSSKPEHTRVVLLDDWTISGSQMMDAYRHIEGVPELRQYVPCIEMNLLTATRKRIEEGFEVTNWNGISNTIPVKTYYRAHTASYANHGAHITGSHSSVDYDFQNPLVSQWGGLTRARKEAGNPVHIPQPPLTAIIRTYRSGEPLITITADGTLRRMKREQ